MNHDSLLPLASSADFTDSIPTDLAGMASSKRPSVSRGIDGFYPYYAGFPASFARSVLERVQARCQGIVLDPWNGSGTTTAVASDLGMTAVGVDLNPAAIVIARGKLARFDSPVHGRELLEQIHRSAKRRRFSSIRESDPLLSWCSLDAVTEVRKIQLAIRSVVRAKTDMVHGSSFLESFFQACLLRSLRQLLVKRDTANPTWVRKSRREGVCAADVHSLFGRLVAEVSESRDFIAEESRRCGRAILMHGDARCLAIPDGAVAVALCSPPYCTRIDYAVCYSMELAALGMSVDQGWFDGLRRNLTGTTMIRPHSGYCMSQWSPGVRQLVESIREHRSFRVNRYYFRSYWQYFEDAHQAVGELARVLAPEGSAYLVVQGSYFRELPVDLSSLYIDMGKKFGLTGDVVATVPVQSYFSRIHRTAPGGQLKRHYSESVICLRKAGSSHRS